MFWIVDHIEINAFSNLKRQCSKLRPLNSNSLWSFSSSGIDASKSNKKLFLIASFKFTYHLSYPWTNYSRLYFPPTFRASVFLSIPQLFKYPLETMSKENIWMYCISYLCNAMIAKDMTTANNCWLDQSQQTNTTVIQHFFDLSFKKWSEIYMLKNCFMIL